MRVSFCVLFLYKLYSQAGRLNAVHALFIIMPTQFKVSFAFLGGQARFVMILIAFLACIDAHVIFGIKREFLETVTPYRIALDEDVPTALPSHSEDEVTLAVRDMSPDILATSLPMPRTSGPTEHPPDNSLKLRSSTHSVSGIDGHKLFAVPIFVADLISLLTHAAIDLKNLNDDEKTNFYQLNSTGWSFSVFAPYATLQYSLIKTIAARFLKLALVSSPSALSSTRIGVLRNGNRPLADIMIMPFAMMVNSSYVPFANFGGDQHFSSSQPTEIINIDPFGITCMREVVNETTELAPIFNTIVNQNLTTRDIADRTLIRIGMTAFAMGVQLMHENFNNFMDANEMAAILAHEHAEAVEVAGVQLGEALVRVSTQLFRAVSLVALMHTYHPHILYAIPMYLNGTGPLQTLDTGFYVLRNLAMRLVMETTKRNDRGELIMLKQETWQRFLQRLIAPFNDSEGRTQMSSQNRSGWAMEGELYGPESGDTGLEDGGDGGHNRQYVIGRWQLWIGDSGFSM